MYDVFVLTSWTETNEMKVAVDYPADWTDKTSQINIPPTPNLVVVQGKVSEEILIQLQNDPDVEILSEDLIEEQI